MSRRQEIEAKIARNQADIESMQAAYSLDAVDHAAAQGIDLDYSEASLPAVEAILGRLHGERPAGLMKRLKRGPTDQQVDQASKMYGAYIGEVMRFAWGKGQWAITEQGPFANICSFGHGDFWVCPQARVYRRIMGGPAENIHHYYQVMKQDQAGSEA